MADSLSPECTPLKKDYDTCFNAWFAGYLEPAVRIMANDKADDPTAAANTAPPSSTHSSSSPSLSFWSSNPPFSSSSSSSSSSSPSSSSSLPPSSIIAPQLTKQELQQQHKQEQAQREAQKKARREAQAQREQYAKEKAEEFQRRCGPIWEQYRLCTQVCFFFTFLLFYFFWRGGRGEGCFTDTD